MQIQKSLKRSRLDEEYVMPLYEILIDKNIDITPSFIPSKSIVPAGSPRELLFAFENRNIVLEASVLNLLHSPANNNS